MTAKFQKNDVIQFVENHKWCPCFGTIEEVKICGDDVRYMIGVPQATNDDSCPIAYIFSMESAHEFEYIGKAVMVAAPIEDDDYE